MPFGVGGLAYTRPWVLPSTLKKKMPFFAVNAKRVCQSSLVKTSLLRKKQIWFLIIWDQSIECSKLSVSHFQQKIVVNNFLCSLEAFQSFMGIMKTILGLNICPIGHWTQPDCLVLAKEGQVKGDLVLLPAFKRVAWNTTGHAEPLF